MICVTPCCDLHYFLSKRRETQSIKTGKQLTWPKMSSAVTNARGKGEDETRPTGKSASVLHIVKTLVQIGNADDSFSKVGFTESRPASSSFDSSSKSPQLYEAYRDSAQVKADGRRLAGVGDELMAKRPGAVDCKGLKLALIVIFSFGVAAKFANFELKNVSI